MDDVTPQYDVFISYARIDGEPHAAKLERVLPNTWRDKRGINPSQDFTAEIERAIRGSRQMVVCVTPDVTREDSFVRQEVAYAAYLKKPIIVARFEEVPPPLPVFNHTWLDFFKLGWETGLQQLQDWLGRFASGSYVPPPPPAELANDPYREYLGDLYEAIVSYLDQTVIRLIEVAGKATPEAVSVSRRPLLASFKARAGINDEGQLISSVSEGMARYKGRMLLLGEPGAGKTTALMSYAKQRVSERLNDPTQPLPILLRCAEWESSPPMTLETWTAKSTEIEKTAISTLKLQEKLLFLLDGLDELGAYRTEKVMEDGREVERSYDPRKRFLDQILPTSEQVMLSCRVQDYVEIYEQVKLNGAVTLQPLIDEQIQDYLHDLSDLWTALQVDAGLVEIARTPLLLSFFAYGFKDAPQEAQALCDLSKAQLGDKIFERYVHERYAHEERRLRDMGEIPPFTLDEIYDVLGHVAMINASGGDRRGGGRIWSEIQDNILLERDFEEKLDQESSAGLIKFVIKLNLIVMIEESLRFIHLRLRDHLVRRYCLMNLEVENVYSSYSEPNPALALASLPDNEGIVKLIALLKSDIVLFRLSAILGLGKTGNVVVVEPLIVPLLRDPDLLVRQMAIVIGCGIGGGEIVRGLLAVLEGDADDETRVFAAEGLRRIKDINSVAGLRISVEQDANDVVRLLAAFALEDIGTPEALEAVQQWREAEAARKELDTKDENKE